MSAQDKSLRKDVDYEVGSAIDNPATQVEVVNNIMKLIDSEKSEAYLGKFEYVDWEVGADDKLRIGDFINCNHQRPHDGYERNFQGQIIEHHSNGVPVIIYNVDPKEPNDSGDYADLQSLYMDGWTFDRIKALDTKAKGDES